MFKVQDSGFRSLGFRGQGLRVSDHSLNSSNGIYIFGIM